MRINRSSGGGASNEAGISGDGGVQKSGQAASIWQGRERSDAADAHGLCVCPDGTFLPGTAILKLMQ